MTDDLDNKSRILMGVISISFLFMAAATPSIISDSRKNLDDLGALPDNDIKTRYADMCIQREAKKIFETVVKTMGADGPHTVTITANPDSESVKSCPQKMHSVSLHIAKAAHHSNISVGLASLVLGAGFGYLALGNRKKNEPKPT
ncbi:hypothetical protein [Micavibrio aeruginosavorus]|uniref:hypothetical protein n=1 Tax=Micavibrio aeruginosavorus TaxID=349221 RepID=UPI003F4AF236